MNAFWDLKIEAQNENEAYTGITAFEKITGLIAKNPHVNEYRKMPKIFETRFYTDGFSDVPDKAIEELRVICDKIGDQWQSNSPHTYPDGQLEWSCTIDSRISKVFVKQLFWAHCQFIPQDTSQAK